MKILPWLHWNECGAASCQGHFSSHQSFFHAIFLPVCAEGFCGIFGVIGYEDKPSDGVECVPEIACFVSAVPAPFDIGVGVVAGTAAVRAGAAAGREAPSERGGVGNHGGDRARIFRFLQFPVDADYFFGLFAGGKQGRAGTVPGWRNSRWGDPGGGKR